MSSPLWIFGYGSLIFRPAFPFIERSPAWIDGWARRFYQSSADHRGVPEAPGRVVTLVPAGGQQVWGMAYRVDERLEEKVLTELDYREKGGYIRLWLPFHLQGEGERTVDGLLYVGSSTNKSYAGYAPIASIAEQIDTAEGPSGRNDDYLFKLEAALAEMGATDPHVSQVADALRALRASR